MEERQKEALDRLRASLKECTVLRAETFRDFIECQQERTRLIAELKEANVLKRIACTDLLNSQIDRKQLHERIEILREELDRAELAGIKLNNIQRRL